MTPEYERWEAEQPRSNDDCVAACGVMSAAMIGVHPGQRCRSVPCGARAWLSSAPRTEQNRLAVDRESAKLLPATQQACRGLG